MPNIMHAVHVCDTPYMYRVLCITGTNTHTLHLNMHVIPCQGL